MKRILWVSRLPRHQGAQTTELKDLFGEDVTVVERDISNAEFVATEYRRGASYNAVVAVVPEAVFERLSVLKLPLIRSESIPEDDPAKIEFRGTHGRGYRHKKFVWYSTEKVTKRL